MYHLGDFGDYSLISRLNGKVILIYGNYEMSDNITEEELEKHGFYKVYTNKIVRRFNDNLFLNMSHEPSKSREFYGKNDFNLFGHIHKLQMVKRFGLNVGVDCHNFYPIDIETVMFYKNTILNFYDEEVFCHKVQ